MIEGADIYELLRQLTPPVVAVTTSAGGRSNGMIANSAQRASLVPAVPRISIYILKTNFSHELVWKSGIFAVQLLRSDDWELVRRLGFKSGREADKLAGMELVEGSTGCPLIAASPAAFECRVVNAMDAGALTFFLGDVVSVREGPAAEPMTSERFRAGMPADIRTSYEAGLRAAQSDQEELARRIRPSSNWPGPSMPV